MRGGADVITRVLLREAEGSESEKEIGQQKQKAEPRGCRCFAAGLEGGGGPGANEYEGPPETGKSGQADSPLEPLEGTQPLDC